MIDVAFVDVPNSISGRLNIFSYEYDSLHYPSAEKTTFSNPCGMNLKGFFLTVLCYNFLNLKYKFDCVKLGVMTKKFDNNILHN